MPSVIQENILTAMNSSFEGPVTAVDLQVFFAGSGITPVWTLEQVLVELDILHHKGAVWFDGSGYLPTPEKPRIIIQSRIHDQDFTEVVLTDKAKWKNLKL